MNQCFKKIVIATFSLIFSLGAVQAQLIEKPELDDVINNPNTPMTGEKVRPRLYLGVYGAYNFNDHLVDFQTLPGFGTCSPGYKEGNGNGYSGGILADYPLSDYSGIEARLGYTQLDGEMVRRGVIGNIKDVNTPGSGIQVETDHILNAKLGAIVFEPMINVRPVSRMTVRLGASLAYLIGADFEYEEAIGTPESVVFLDGTASRNKQSGEIPELNAFLPGLTAGVGYEFPMARNLYLSPEARYTLYFSDISSVSWKVASMQFGASLKYAFMPEPERLLYYDTLYRRDTVVVATPGITTERTTLTSSTADTDERREERYTLIQTTFTEQYTREIPKNTSLTAQITATGIAPDGSRQPQPTIVVEETEWEELFPLLPYVFFKEGNSDVTDTRLNLLKSDATAGFSEQKLPLSTLGVYAELLNIIGSRMRENPSAKITLVGTNNNLGVEAKNTKLSGARAEAVKQYLTSVWNIQPNRIQTEARNLPAAPSNNAKEDGQVENRRVEIKSSTYDIIKPIRKQEIVRTATPPLVELAQSATAEAGLKTWEVRVEQGGQTLRTFTNEIPSVPDVLRWRIDEAPMPQLEEPVTVSLRVSDAEGKTETVQTSLKVQQLTIKKKRFEKINDKRVERYSLILFEFDKAELGPENATIANEIKKRIEPNSTITIAGYADRMGDSEYNRQLALRRCKATQKALGLPDDRVVLKPIGSDSLLFNNDIPEGRSYSRTVQVIVETPVTE